MDVFGEHNLTHKRDQDTVTVFCYYYQQIFIFDKKFKGIALDALTN